MISTWSLLSATLWFTLFSLLLWLLRHRTDFLMRYGTAFWSMAVLLTVVRLLLPLDSSHVIVLRSYKLLPMLRRFLKFELVPGVSVRLILLLCWIGGTLVFLIRSIRDMRRSIHTLRRRAVRPIPPQVLEAADACGVSEQRVCVTDATSIPFSLGALHPTIYLPDITYQGDDLIWILRHETAHISGHDTWIRLGFLLFRGLFWWNPLVHLAQKSLDDILELRCDKNVLADLDHDDRVAYTETLHRVGCQSLPATISLVGAGTFVQPQRISSLVLRAQMALECPRPHIARATIAFVLSLALFATSYCFILQPAGAPPEWKNGEGVYRISGQTSYLKRLPSGDYELWCDGNSLGTVSADALQDEMYQGLEVLP